MAHAHKVYREKTPVQMEPRIVLDMSPEEAGRTLDQLRLITFMVNEAADQAYNPDGVHFPRFTDGPVMRALREALDR